MIMAPKRKHDDTDDIIPLLLALLLLLNLFPDLVTTAPVKKQRKVRAQNKRLPFEEMLHRHASNNPSLRSLLRMSLDSFKRLVLLLETDLIVDESYAVRRGGAICPSYCVFITLRFLAGARYQDICEMCKASPTAVYFAVHKTLQAIVCNPELSYKFPETKEECEILANGFENISYKSAITNCVGAVDGWLLPIKVPSKAEAGNVQSYFSGHYARHGMNVQAVCDSYCRFTFVSVSSPGSVNDRDGALSANVLWD
jgi:DDE superfamily endonuclease